MDRLSSLILMFFFFAGLSAQEAIRYTTNDGLPSNHIYDIQQDKDGLMWFATNRGVVKFDGTNFKTFTSKNGLPNNDTWRLEPDLEGRMWYYSKSKYQGYIKNDSVYKFVTEDSLVTSPAIWYKSKDTLQFYASNWIYKLEDVIFKKERRLLDDRNNQFLNKKYGYDNSKDGLMFNPELNHHILIKDNRIWFLDREFKTINKIDVTTPHYSSGMKIRNSGMLYNKTMYYTTSEGILFFNYSSNKAAYFSYEELLPKVEVEHFRPNGLLDEIQISVQGYLLRFTYDFELIEIINHSNELPVQNSYRDINGNIWLSNFSKGIAFVPNSQHSTAFLKGKKVQKLGEVQNRLFAGVESEGFYEFETSIGNFNQNAFIKAVDDIYQIKEDVKNNQGYFVSMRRSMILDENAMEEFYMNNFNERFTNEKQYSFKDLIQFNNSIYAITANSVLKHDLKSLKDISVFTEAGLIEFEIFNQDLYFAASDGLFKIANDSVFKIPSQNDILETSVSALLGDKDYLWVGTDGRGIYSYNENGINHITSTEDLSVQRIVRRDSILWLATQDGVKKILINSTNIGKSNIIDSFYEQDGLMQTNTNDILLKDNFLFAATDIGLVKLDLTDSIYKKPPSLHFKTKTDTLVFEGDDRNNISISFANLSFAKKDQNSYAHRLIPDHYDWSSTTTKTLNFTNLSPKFYSLEVRATDQHMNTTIKKIYLDVQPLWWQTDLAKFGFIVLGLGFLYLLYKLTQKQIHEIESSKAERDKRVAGLELQALRSQMNPHFVHNSLNAIQYFIQRNEVELSEDYLAKFSKLIRLFFEYSRKQHITIEDEVSLLENYLQIEKLRFEDKLAYSIEIDDRIQATEQILPSMILQPIVENAVNHGVFHKKGNGIVKVRFNYIDASTFEIMILDDGIGINKAREIHKRSTKNYQSNSSSVLKERVELLQQSEEWDISYSLEDRSENSDETGTIATLVFKNTNDI